MGLCSSFSKSMRISGPLATNPEAGSARVALQTHLIYHGQGRFKSYKILSPGIEPSRQRRGHHRAWCQGLASSRRAWANAPSASSVEASASSLQGLSIEHSSPKHRGVEVSRVPQHQRSTIKLVSRPCWLCVDPLRPQLRRARSQVLCQVDTARQN